MNWSITEFKKKTMHVVNWMAQEIGNLLQSLSRLGL